MGSAMLISETGFIIEIMKYKIGKLRSVLLCIAFCARQIVSSLTAEHSNHAGQRDSLGENTTTSASMPRVSMQYKNENA